MAVQILHTCEVFSSPLCSQHQPTQQKQISFVKKCLHTARRQRQCHECQLHFSYLEIRFNLISYCLHLSWINNKNGLFPGIPGGETNLKMVNSKNSGKTCLCIWTALFVCTRLCVHTHTYHSNHCSYFFPHVSQKINIKTYHNISSFQSAI